jgi:ribonuclease BN (tRNA processing enzyme)
MNTNSRLTILGTTSQVDALDRNRTSAGVLLEVDGSQILIDCGIGTITRLVDANIDVKKTNIILISNNDTAYCNDINAVIEQINNEIHLICPLELLKHDDSILIRSNTKNLKVLSINTNEEKHTNIKNIEIYSEHNKSKAMSYKLTTSKYVLGYITKAKYSRKFVESFKECNILIIHLTTLNHEKNIDYLDVEEITEMIREINPELVILAGFSRKIIDSDPLDISRKIKQELQKDKNQPIRTQILPAKELMSINPESYNIILKQKKLKGFF